MHRNEFELAEMVHARRSDVYANARRTTIRTAPLQHPVARRVRRAIGQRFVVIGTVLAG